MALQTSASFINLPAHLRCSSVLRRRFVRQTADRAGRIDGRHDPAFGIEDEASCLEIDGIVIDGGAGG
ncbi:MAG TPA: hypothetical protein VGN00_22835 [Puia sp.]